MNHEKPQNPSAFPITATEQSFFNQNPLMPETGMTLRDYFAAKAMQAYLSNHLALKMEDREGWAVRDMVDSSFVIADEMLKQREQ